MFKSELAQSMYNEIKTYNDHSVEQIKQGLTQAYEVLLVYPEHTTATAYIEAFEKHLKEITH